MGTEVAAMQDRGSANVIYFNSPVGFGAAKIGKTDRFAQNLERRKQNAADLRRAWKRFIERQEAKRK